MRVGIDAPEHCDERPGAFAFGHLMGGFGRRRADGAERLEALLRIIRELGVRELLDELVVVLGGPLLLLRHPQFLLLGFDLRGGFLLLATEACEGNSEDEEEGGESQHDGRRKRKKPGYLAAVAAAGSAAGAG